MFVEYLCKKAWDSVLSTFTLNKKKSIGPPLAYSPRWQFGDSHPNAENFWALNPYGNTKNTTNMHFQCQNDGKYDRLQPQCEKFMLN